MIIIVTYFGRVVAWVRWIADGVCENGCGNLGLSGGVGKSQQSVTSDLIFGWWVTDVDQYCINLLGYDDTSYVL